MKINKRGISLIVLVITIVVIIIIAAAIILSMGKNNPIESAREASFKQRVDSYKAELTNYMSKKFADSLGVISSDDIDATSTEDIKKIVTSLSKEDESKFIIENGKLIYIAKDEKEIEWCTQLMVDTTALVAKISANVTSPTDASSIIYTFKFNTDVTGFESDDIQINTGNKGEFAIISPSEYTLVVTNTGGYTQTVTVPKNVCKDASGNDNKLSSYSIVITERATATITNMTNGDLSISATVTVDGIADYSNSKYVFTTSSDPLGTDDSTKYKDGNLTSANNTITKAKVAGTYYLHVLLASTSGTLTEIISDTTATCQGKKDFASVDSSNITLIPGKYKLEVWGAQGHTGSYGRGGYGGYSTGEYLVNSDTSIYVVVGGTSNSDTGGYNGGGNGKSNGYGGGGATHIGLKSGLLTEFASDYANQLLIVAGGGGSGSNSSSNIYGTSEGGEGGGWRGGYGGGYSSNNKNGTYGSAGYGTQTSGGAYGANGGAGTNGTFGKGGTGSSHTYSGPGGGGGFYGGGGGGAGCGGRRRIWLFEYC